MKIKNSFQFSPGRFAIHIETYFFSVLFILFTIHHLIRIYHFRAEIPELLHQLAEGRIDMYKIYLGSNILLLIILSVFSSINATLLMIRKRLHQYPEGFSEIFVPLMATFGNILSNVIPSIPKNINFFLFPEYILIPSICIGNLFAITGLTISAIAVMKLKYSFGIFVQVRDIVTKGLYKYVRHPMYLGHILTNIGFFLISPTIGFGLLSSIIIILTVYRAHLEERKLAQYSKEYQEYMKNTPFLFPFRTK